MEEKFYQVASAEKTTKSAAEQETRTLLFLMGYLQDSEKIETFIIDVFNDVTALDRDETKIWDAQSKGDGQCSPKEIGKDLVTLFRNFISIIDFNYYILSIKDISNKNLTSVAISCKNPITILTYSDFTDDAKAEIKNGLLIACNDKTYIDNDYSEKDIDDFLNKVIIVLNNDKPQNYIKKIAFTKEEIIDEKVLIQIFNEIKIKQISIKTSSDVNGIILNSVQDVHKLGRDLNFITINSLILSRIINNDFLDKNNGSQYIPIYFSDYLISLNLSDEDKIDLLQDCINDIYRILSFKNMNKEFWNLLNDIVIICKENKGLNVKEIYEMINKKNIYCSSIKVESMLYFIACIKGGLKDEY